MNLLPCEHEQIESWGKRNGFKVTMLLGLANRMEMGISFVRALYAKPFCKIMALHLHYCTQVNPISVPYSNNGSTNLGNCVIVSTSMEVHNILDIALFSYSNSVTIIQLLSTLNSTYIHFSPTIICMFTNYSLFQLKTSIFFLVMD